MSGGERLLERMQPAAGRQALDGHDLVPVRLRREEQAGAHRQPVIEHGAGAADAVFAPDMGAGQRQLVAQEIHEQQPGLDPALVTHAVDGDRHLAVRGAHPAARSLARATARRVSTPAR